MAWTTPITDRTAADITNRTSKAFFNIADLVRIIDNTDVVVYQAFLKYGLTTSITAITPLPDITDFADVDMINQLVENINTVRTAILTRTTLPGVFFLKDDYVAGPGQRAPDYHAVNAWENNLALMYAKVSA